MNALSAIRTGLPYLNGMPGAGPGAGPMPAAARLPASVGDARDLREIGQMPGVAEPAVARPADGSFGNVLGRLIGEVNGRQMAAGQAVAGLQSGSGVTLQQAMITMEEASVSFQLMAEVRNKLLESYQELMRMQV